MGLFNLLFENEYDRARRDAKDYYLHGKINRTEYLELLDVIDKEEELDNL